MAQKARVAWPRIFLFGDSLTQHCFSTEGCWGSVVATAFERKCDVVARGFSGYNSRMCKYVLPRVLGPEDASTVAAFVICLGANDCSSFVEGGDPAVPLHEYVRNMEEMLSYVKICGIPDENIVIITPPVADNDAWIASRKTSGLPLKYRSVNVISTYANACKTLGSKRNLTVVDTFTAFLKEQNWKDLFVDGLHFSQAGSYKLANLLIPPLEKIVGHLPSMFPDFRDLDAIHPEESLRTWSATD
ncbi:isoamyl acetate-hydrolyzing esterase 1 homolog [Ixodes scapularis]|uniref:isoamyl acetate-hydrolyzing esterase 1 homolog n=1 Tax=Ixodes scapularis TaxID=6945 RepID=UPI001A9E57CA|nr:isoamyl acetate-hydrolyzing esterase 1 homolog [Ixodes scapularis]